MFVKSVYDFEKKIEGLKIHKVSVATWYLLKLYLNITAPICYKLTKRKDQKSVCKYTHFLKMSHVNTKAFDSWSKTIDFVSRMNEDDYLSFNQTLHKYVETKLLNDDLNNSYIDMFSKVMG